MSSRLSVCLSVTLVDCNHIGWKSWKLNAQTIVGSGSGISEDSCDYKIESNDVTIKQNPRVMKPRSSALSPRLPRAQKLSSPSTSATNARTMFFHVKNATQHLHQNCLYTLTSSYRHLANNYTLLLNASTTHTICWPGVESSYTSICLSFGNSLNAISQRWLNTNRYARIY